MIRGTRKVLALLVLAVAAGLVGYFGFARQTTHVHAAVPTTVAADAPVVTLYKSPTCHCCAKWGDHLREHGFQVIDRDSGDLLALKHEHGIPQHLWSCHMGVVDGYVFEGHIPAHLVRRVLRERPAIAGIAVPGMPLGSPGMEAGFRKERYEVIAFGGAEGEYVFDRR
jgi:hypothetical protein